MSLSRPAVLALALFAAAALAQAPNEERGSAPPGTSRDGAGPSDGAIRGGTILPGEQGGMPTVRVPSRCDELTGTLREDCLREERKAGAGGTAPEGMPSRGLPPSPTPTAPPQNPRPR